MKKIIFTFVLLFLPYGVSVGVSVAQKWTVYTVEDGLVGNSISSIREDKKGYLWFITRFGGVSRYDGKDFQKFHETDGLAGDNIYFILADKSGNVWFATDCGVSRYDGNEFKTFDEKDGLANNIVTFILEDGKGNLWFATDRGVSRYDGKKYDGKDFQNYDDADSLAGENVTFIFEDGEGNLWFATNSGAVRYNGRDFHKFGYDDELADNDVTFILEDKKNNLWFGTEKRLYRKTTKSLKKEGRLGTANVSSILEDQQGNVWFATDLGASMYDAQDFSIKNDLVDDGILSMLEDSRGNLWFGTEESIIKFEGKDFSEKFTEVKDTALKPVNAIWEDRDENLWFGTENGVYKYTIERLQRFTDKNGLADNNILSTLQDSQDNIWIGTPSGVSKYDGKNFKPIPRMNIAVIAILEDESENVWFATPEGIVKYDTAKESPKDLLPIDDISAMLMDRDDNLWIGSLFDGIYRYEKALRPFASLQKKHYTMENTKGLASNEITWILETQDGNLWFGLKGEIDPGGARGGVCRFDGTDFKSFTTDDGFPSDSIEVAFEDNKGNLWLETADKGVIKCDSRSIGESLSLPTITKADGLISNNVRAILSDSEGNLWFGTDEGVSKYDGENFQNIWLKEVLTLGYIRTIFEDSEGAMWFITTHSGVIKYIPPAKEICPRIHITQIEADKIYYNVDEIRVPSTTKRITLAYKGISFKSKPNKMRYICQLEGNGENRSLSTNEIRVGYEHLKPGRYQFRVKAIDEDLYKSESPATAYIDIFRPFYLTPQFIIPIIFGGICLLGSGGYLILQFNKQRRIAVQLREKLVKQQEVERVQAAKMESLHQLVSGIAHVIYNQIAVIYSNHDVSERAIGKIKGILTGKYPQAIEEDKQLNRVLSVMEKGHQTGKGASKKIKDVVDGLRSFARLDEADWQQDVDIHEGIDNTIALMEMEPEFSSQVEVKKDYGDIPKIDCYPRSLNQVFRDMLKNAYEAIEGEGEIQIKTFAEEENVKIQISDTGTGIPAEDIARIFDPSFTTKGVRVGFGFGLSICYKIIYDEHRGRIDVSSELGKGTTFTVTLPQHHDREETQ